MVGRVIGPSLPDGSVGLRCSKPGYDVASNPADPAQLAFDSGWQSILSLYYVTGVFALANAAPAVYFTYPAPLAQPPFFSWLVADWLAGPWCSVQAYATLILLTGGAIYQIQANATAAQIAFYNGSGATVYLAGFVYRQGPA